MDLKLATTKNTQGFTDLMERVREPVCGVARFGLAAGVRGTGKTTIAMDYARQQGYLYTRTVSVTSPTSLMENLLGLVGAERQSSRCEAMLRQLAARLAEKNKILIVDEVDKLTEPRTRHIEVLRDLLDLANVPIVMVGEENIWQKLDRYPQLKDRIGVRFNFDLFDINDIENIASQVLSFKFDKSALELIQKQSEGKLRKITTVFQQAQRIASRNSLKLITADHLAKKKGRK